MGVYYKDTSGGAGSTNKAMRKHTDTQSTLVRRAAATSDPIDRRGKSQLSSKHQQAPNNKDSTPPHPDRNPLNMHPHTRAPHPQTRPRSTPEPIC